MVSFLRRLLGGGPVQNPVITPPDFRGPTLPPVDEPPPILAVPPEEAEDAPVAGRGFIICYVDANGNPSERRIICRRVYEADGLFYVGATCLERHAARTFRRDRIREVYCGVTGEDLGRPDRVFLASEFNEDRPRPPAEDRRVKAAIRVLMTVARSDGEVHVAERRVLQEFIRAAIDPKRPSGDVASLYDYGLRVAPDFEEFMKSVATVCKGPDCLAALMFDAMIDMGNADGQFVLSELEVVQDIAELAQEHGHEINITVIRD